MSGARDMPFAMLTRKAEGLGYRWDGTDFVHAALRLRVAPAPKGTFASGPAGMDCRRTFQRLVDRHNEAAKQVAA